MWGMNPLTNYGKVSYWNLASLCYITKGKLLSNDSYENLAWKLPGCFVYMENQAKPPLENEIFVKSWLYCIYNSKTIKICQTSANFLRFLFTENFSQGCKKFNHKTVFTSKVVSCIGIWFTQLFWLILCN